MKNPKKAPVEVGPIRCEQGPGYARVTAAVDGGSVWFETTDGSLRAAPEAFASALLVPAMALGRDLTFSDGLDARWMHGAERLQQYFHRWWGYGKIALHTASQHVAAKGKKGRRALLFSAGVDAFHSLFQGPEAEVLVFVHGYDIPLADQSRARLMEKTLREVAAACGRQAVVVRTNLRQHPVAGRRYRHAFGGALAAIGHLLAGVDELVVSSSISLSDERPCASRWDIDPLWSSNETQIVHFGADVMRNDKLRSIMEQPLVRQHLRVCLQDTGALNCGVCEKCLRTMLVLEQAGCLSTFRTFDLSGLSMASRIDRLSFLKEPQYVLPFYEDPLRLGLPDDLARAVKALMVRSRRLKPLQVLGRRVPLTVSALLLPLPWRQRLAGVLRGGRHREKGRR